MAWGTTQDPHGGANDGRAETRQYKSLQRVGPKNIPVSKQLVTPIYKPFRPFRRSITTFRGPTNHGY